MAVVVVVVQRGCASRGCARWSWPVVAVGSRGRCRPRAPVPVPECRGQSGRREAWPWQSGAPARPRPRGADGCCYSYAPPHRRYRRYCATAAALRCSAARPRGVSRNANVLAVGEVQGPEGATLTWTWSSLNRPPLAGHTGCLAVYSVVVTHGVDWRFPGVSQLPPQLLEKAMPPRSGGGLSRSGACACTVLRCACAGAPLLALRAGAGLASSLRPLSCPPPRPPPRSRGLARSPPAGSGWPGRVCPK